jgi:predicted NAD/FAD-binding protein
MSAERAILGRFHYESSEIVVHSDTRLMPSQRRDWAPVNFMVSADHDKPMASIWMNAVQPGLGNARNLVQTWNPIVAPNADSVLARARFQRPVVTHESLEAVDQLLALQRGPGNRVWFCGSYSRRGIPLLESAATSAIEVAEALGS